MELQEYLMKNDISVEYFSVLSGVAYSSIYAIMRGARNPRKETAEKIRKASKGKVVYPILITGKSNGRRNNSRSQAGG